MLTGDTTKVRKLFDVEHDLRYGQAAIEEQMVMILDLDKLNADAVLPEAA